MTRRVEGQDAMHGVHGKESPATRGGGANQIVFELQKRLIPATAGN